MEGKRILKTFFAFWIAVFLFNAPDVLYGQKKPLDRSKLRIPDEKSVQILTLEGGSTIIGRISEIKETDILFESDAGSLTIAIDKISEVKEVQASLIKAGKYWFPNPNATRLFFAPTGRSLNRGEGYVADYYIFFPMIAYGVTDRISLGGGGSLFPGAGIKNQILYFTPKVGLLRGEKLNLAAGILLAKMPGFWADEAQITGILYGVGTFGPPDACVTAGLGYGFEGAEFATKPMVMLGGELRASRRLSFVSENWIFPGADEPLVSYGIRLFGETMSVDLGFITALGENALIPGLPYIDFVFKF